MPAKKESKTDELEIKEAAEVKKPDSRRKKAETAEEPKKPARKTKE